MEVKEQEHPKTIEYKDGYIRPEQTNQDIISNDPVKLQERLKGYIKIHPNNYKDIHCGIWIKYITADKKYRSGGILKINKAPDYFIVYTPYYKRSWSVSLKDAEIYMQGSTKRLDTMIEKNNLYKLYQAGLVQIVEDVDVDDPNLLDTI